MVEKVFISPNRVRAYGNIVNMKTGDDFTLVNSELTVTTDMVGGAEMTVFSMECEAHISVSATNPYLLSGETTDIVAKLKKCLYKPLANKNVTIEQSVFRDNGTTVSHNDDWVKYNPDNITITRGEEYTSVTGSDYRYGVPISNNCKIRVETRKPTASSGPLLSIWAYASNPLSASQLLLFSVTELGMTQGTFANIEMTVTPTAVTVKNLDNGTTITKEYSTSNNLIFNFWGTTFDYKNFKIYETINGVTDENGEFALNDVSVTGNATFTASYNGATSSCDVYYPCLFVDYGTTSNYSNWDTVASTMQMTRQDTYTELKRKTDASSFGFIAKDLSVTDRITIEFDFKQATLPSSNKTYFTFRATGGAVKLGIYRGYENLADGQWHHYKFDVNGLTVTPTIDKIQRNNLTLNGNFNYVQLDASEEAVHHFKNFVVY